MRQDIEASVIGGLLIGGFGTRSPCRILSVIFRIYIFWHAVRLNTFR